MLQQISLLCSDPVRALPLPQSSGNGDHGVFRTEDDVVEIPDNLALLSALGNGHAWERLEQLRLGLTHAEGG